MHARSTPRSCTSAARRRTTWWWGTTCSTGCPAARHGGRSGGGPVRRPLGELGRGGRRRACADQARRPGARGPRRRGGQDRAVAPTAGRRWARPASPAPTRWSASAAARSPTWPASSRRPGCAGCAWCRCRPPLLGMVDAAVGGKTGINTAAGKNLVGAFHPPAGVLCDLATLRTLPRDELVAGLGRGGQVRLHRRPGRSSTWSRPTRPRRSTADSAAAARADRAGHPGQGRRGGRRPARDRRPRRPGREVLNYGHTLAHAIEQVERLRWRHGDAVAGRAGLRRRARRRWPAVSTRHRGGTAPCSMLGLPHVYRAAWPSCCRDAGRQEGPRRRCASWCSTARPTGDPEGSGQGAAAAAYQEARR